MVYRDVAAGELQKRCLPYEVSRDLGITQKSAWFLLGRLRLALQVGSIEKTKLAGTLEADETFVGGKAKYMHKDAREKKITGRGTNGKTIVAGVLQRGETYLDENGEEKKTASQVNVGILPDTSAAALESLVTTHAEEGSNSSPTH